MARDCCHFSDEAERPHLCQCAPERFTVEADNDLTVIVTTSRTLQGQAGQACKLSTTTAMATRAVGWEGWAGSGEARLSSSAIAPTLVRLSFASRQPAEASHL